MITVDTLFEAHLVVANVDVSIAFYRDVLGFELAYTTDDREAAFFWIGSRGRTMLGVWAAGSAPMKITNHVAFAAALDDVLASPRALKAADVTPLDFDGLPADEPVVIGWMPAAAVYFRDPDGHLLEFVAMLDGDPHPEWGVLPWSAWQRRLDSLPLDDKTPDVDAVASDPRLSDPLAAAIEHLATATRAVSKQSADAIVLARPEDLDRVPHIELAAAQLLRGHAPEAVLLETTSLDTLREARAEGRLWVALVNGMAVGFAHVVVDDDATAHLEEIDVLPDYGRRGLGTRLVMQVCGWAADNGYGSVTLTTFRHVPWNQPFYERLGFRVVPARELSPALLARVEDETRRGLDPSSRVAMQRPCEVVVSDHAAPEDLAFLEDQINEHNFATTGIRDARLLVIVLRNRAGRIHAGLSGHTWGGVAEVRFLWVDESKRRRGLGTRLLGAAEREARLRRCRKVVLSTHSFQAPDFYERLGYRAVGAFSDYPAGYASIFFEKALP